MVRRLQLGAIVIGAGLAASPALGTTRRVPTEYPTIQAGIDGSAVGDTVLVGPGVYTHYETRDLGTAFPWTACVFMKDGVIVKSESGSAATLIDMQNASGPQPQVVLGRDLSSAQTSLEGFTITGSPVGGGGAYLVGTLSFKDCLFRDLDAGESDGAGLAVNGNPTLISCEFVNCVANGGGAISHANGRIEMHDCYVHECRSIAVLCSGNDVPPEESALIEGCTFTHNWNAHGGGGALQVADYLGRMIVRDCRFEDNEDRGTGGGGIAFGIVGPGSVIEDCLFLNNRTIGGNGVGGAVSTGGACSVQRCTFWGNHAPTAAGGDAVGFFSTGSTLANNVIAGCTGRGAVMAYQANLQSSCNVFWQNAGGLGRYYTPGPTDRVVDPLFCDVVGEDFHVMMGSPCVPPGSLDCGQIGAFGQGCGAVSIEPHSWGEVKAAYRGQEGSKR